MEGVDALKMMRFDRELSPLKDVTQEEIVLIREKYGNYDFFARVNVFLMENVKGRVYEDFSYDAAASIVFYPDTTVLEKYFFDGTWGRWVMELPTMAMQLMYLMRRMREMISIPVPEHEEVAVKLRKHWLITVQATGMYIRLGDPELSGYMPLPYYGIEQHVIFTHETYSVYVKKDNYTELESFFETAYKIVHGKDLDYKDQQMYKTHAVIYALRFRDSHMAQLSLVSFKNDVVAPGDGSAAAKQIVERSGFKCDSSDIYPGDPSVRVSTISAALKEGDRSKTLILCYINHFLTKDDWRIVEEYSSVVFLDAPFTVPLLPMERKGVFWVKEIPMIKKKIQQESFSMFYPDTLFTERLVSNSCYEVRQISNYVEYIFQMVPSTRMMSHNPNVQLLLTSKGFPLPYENETPLLLITGLNELTSEDAERFFYYAPIGRSIMPIELRVVQPHHKLLTRELYYCDLLDFWFLRGEKFAREVDGKIWMSVRSEGKYWVKFRDAALMFRFSHKKNIFEFVYTKQGEVKVVSKEYTVTVGKHLMQIMSVYDHLYERDSATAYEFLAFYGLQDTPFVRRLAKFKADVQDLRICEQAVYGLRSAGNNIVWKELMKSHTLEELRALL